jgi:signal transduction histidine kinase
MSDPPLKVLLIEDDEEDYLIARDVLSEVPGTRYEITWVSRSEEALAALLGGEHDVCLLDMRLGGCTGLEILRQAHGVGCAIPVIMLTGAAEREVDVAAMDAGAADYLDKGRLDPRLLERVIRYAIGHKRGEIELKRYADALAQKNAELLRLNEEKNGFVGMAAHDLRNPLGVILGYSDFLLMTHRRTMKKSDLEIIGKIKSSSKFMLSLIDDLLDISTIESGKLTLDRRSSDLAQLVESNVGLNTVLASQKGMTLTCESDPDVPRADVDARQVEQVLNNLISNAIHYSPPGTAIRVQVRLRGAAEAARGDPEGGEEVLISVADQGPGIAPEDIKNLFRPFGRAKSVSTGGERSTGLGLAIARRIIEGHGGRIWVESELHRGSTFFVALRVGAERGRGSCL